MQPSNVTMSLIRLLLFTLILLSWQASACTNCWVLFNGKCYAFTESFMRWSHARSFCQKFGDDGDMLIIKSITELNFLKAEISRRSKFYWTGATDEGSECIWRWVDGSPWDPAIGSQMWWQADGKPRSDIKYNCAYARNVGDWDSMSCTKTTRALCKRSLGMGLGLWTTWGACSKTCGNGNRVRTRLYDNPTPSNGGNDCNHNDLMETKFCKLIDCPVNGAPGPWTAWVQCSTTCGDGEKIRTRECNNPAPAYGGDECNANDLTERMPCKAQECAVNGAPGPWTAWVQCSTTCGEKTRTRECNNPAPAYGGDGCNANNLTERIPCKTQECTGAAVKGLWTYCAPLIIILGTIGNTLSLLVLTRKNMRKNISSIYLSVLAVVDTTVLYTGLLRHWIRHISDTDIQSISIGGCKFHLFIVFFSLDLSAWILVAVTFERLVAVYIPNKARIYCTRFTTYLTVCVMSLALSLINHHFFWTLEDIKMNDLGGLECVYNEEVKDFMMYTWPWIYKCLAVFIPLIITLTGNVLIIIKILKLRSANESKMTSMTAMLLTVNFGFIICTSPIALNDNFKTTWYPADLPYAICSLLMYTNNSINFLLYCLSGPKFRKELRKLFSRRKENRVAPESNIQSLPDVTLPDMPSLSETSHERVSSYIGRS